MIFTVVDAALIDTRAAVEDLRKEAFKWNPHVTFPEMVWNRIRTEGLAGNDVIANIGILTLFVKEFDSTWKAVHTFP